MGKPTPTAGDGALAVLRGSFAASGQSQWLEIQGGFNLWLWGVFNADVLMEASFDGGVTAIPLSRDTTGADATFSKPVKFGAFEIEAGVLVRLNCTRWTSGAVNYRISK